MTEHQEFALRQSTVTDQDLAELIATVEEAASAFVRGDMRRYFTLINHADDYTLLTPYGGEPRRGTDTSPEYIESMSRFFQGGEAQLELIETYTSGNLAVLVAIERQHCQVGGLPDQDWSLRVTLVFRREGDNWLLVHRHADPLVHGKTLDQISVLARS